MRKNIIILIAVFIFLIALWLIRKQNTSIEIEKDLVEVNQVESQSVEVGTDEVYKINIIKNINLNDVDLIPNFEEKLTSAEVIEQQKCNKLISGGFYDKQDQPIGLFIASHKKMQDFETNRLFNGILIIEDSKAEITKIRPESNPKTAVQSGPILVSSGVVQQINLENDKNARRMVATVNSKGELSYLTIYDGQSVFLGPQLSDLPKLLQEYAVNNDLEIVDAINLDGGTASVFIANGTKLSELQYSGSFFCIK